MLCLWQKIRKMYVNKKFLWVVATGVMFGMSSDIDNNQNNNIYRENLRKKIQNNRDELNKIPQLVSVQQQDSIAHFDKTNPDALLLQQKQQEKLNLQIKITKIAEQSWREYWLVNFPKYKDFIYSGFSDDEIKELSAYVNKVHFSLSCDLDTNYYKSLDEILYGPYWREFAENIRADAPKLAKKYTNVRKNAEIKYPYIFTRNVFYDGTIITVCADNFGYTNRIFTQSIQTGLESLRAKSNNPDIVMRDFNKLRNVSNVFTTDIRFWIESIFITDQEFIDLKSKLFAPHYTELLDSITQIILLDSEIRKLNIQHNQDIQNIKQHFESIAKQREDSKLEQIENLQNLLENAAVQKTR